MLKTASSFHEAQILQREDYSLTIYVAGGGDAMQKDIQKVRQMFSSRIGNEIPIAFEIVDKIPRTKGNKLRLVISEIKTPQGGNHGK
jgi:phenylacetate-coenzyme A ligase PaaK-like adenylate-forming protein